MHRPCASARNICGRWHRAPGPALRRFLPPACLSLQRSLTFRYSVNTLYTANTDNCTTGGDLRNAPLPHPVMIDRSGAVLTFTLNNADAGNEVTGPMFDAMIAAQRSAHAGSARFAHPRTRRGLLHRSRARRQRCSVHPPGSVAPDRVEAAVAGVGLDHDR